MDRWKKLLTVSIVVISLAILLVPYQRIGIGDGGSYGYSAVLYEVIFHNSSMQLYPESEKGVSIRVFRCFDIYFKTG